MRLALGLLGALVVLYAALVLALYLGQRQLIYPAPRGAQPIPAGFQALRLHTQDGLELRAAWREPQPGKRMIVFFHGNGDSLPGAAQATLALAEAGYGLLLADYRGYAGNPGSPSEAGLIADGRAALAFLKSQGYAPDQQIIMGASLGGGVATQMAREEKPAALVLESTFTSLPDVGTTKFPLLPVHALMKDRFESLAALPGVDAPVLVVHARNDGLIPFAQGEALAAATPRAGLIAFPDGNHTLQFTRKAQEAIVRWLDALP